MTEPCMQTAPTKPHSAPPAVDGSHAATTAVVRSAPYSLASLAMLAATSAANALASFCRLVAGDAPAQRGEVVERVTVENGVVCVAHYIRGRLVDQRRVKAAELVIERRLDRARRCMRVDITTAGRTLEIGRHATPAEKESAVERLAAGLRGIEVEPRIRTTFVEALRRAPRTGARLAARFRFLLRRRGVRRSSGASVSIPPESSVRSSRPAGVRAAPGGGRRFPSALRSRRWWIAAAAVIVLSSAAAPRFAPHSNEATARGFTPSFRLTATNGDIVDEKTMLGRPYAIFFGFARCPEVCPSTLLEVARASNAADASGSGFDILFVTLDPERDTPETLADFVSSFERRIIGLRGAPAEIDRAAQAFRVYRRKVPLEGGDYTIDHTTLVYLVDREGVMSGVASFTERGDEAAKTLKDFIRRHSASQRRSGSRRVAKRGRRRERALATTCRMCARERRLTLPGPARTVEA
ncbi:SCO family protein [Methylosinus sp. H3A]|uniref:SCO family protein n=1 Tax=Methylosinus sp. H3A TaxID=2785786 RepID=UPI0018C2BBE8|nr:SCO family protein [Methylosinus sp. H3A]MBG0810524.1 SCO family protein [Methylosinus sp. H3A]